MMKRTAGDTAAVNPFKSSKKQRVASGTDASQDEVHTNNIEGGKVQFTRYNNKN
jgi:hypothetical protein